MKPMGQAQGVWAGFYIGLLHVNIENTADERKCAEGVPNYWIVTLPVRTIRASRLGDADDGRRDQIIDGQLDHAGILERVAKGRQVFYAVKQAVSGVRGIACDPAGVACRPAE